MYLTEKKRQLYVPLEAEAVFHAKTGIVVFIGTELGGDVDTIFCRDGCVELPMADIIEDAVNDIVRASDESQRFAAQKTIAAYLRMLAANLEVEGQEP
ncbi:hypothetical protein UFOVP354_52 [uncultured Caudovirales phage]|uniref:Uncharacterized protein n=1 Tax=uncultured Caudovirales phage TaxID=2100421 RepID=A0A6J5LZJ5_9CAUD|nr:hypothetical protein UFOVP354_52 [uncultured Caudovirales phage]